jgi:hypothetical protein
MLALAPPSASASGEGDERVRREFPRDIVAIAADDVWAVGYRKQGAGYRPRIRHFDGTDWRTISGPDDYNYLTSVAAVSPSDIWAVGTTAFFQHTYALHWDGATWTEVATPRDEGSTNQASDVSAITSDRVYMFGTTCEAGDCAPIANRWDGDQWRPASAKLRGLRAIDGVSPVDAWGVGGRDRGNGIRPIARHWDGERWTSVRLPRDAPAGLRSVAAIASDDAWAVGLSLVLHWDGVAWKQMPMPEVSLTVVDSVRTDDVWALGLDGGQDLVEHWDGDAWSVIPTPVDDIVGADLASLSVVRADEAWIVGRIPGEEATSYEDIVLRWDGEEWSLVD